METVIIAVVTFAPSLLIFLSGLGIGTILHPLLVINPPTNLSIALIGVIHFPNQFFIQKSVAIMLISISIGLGLGFNWIIHNNLIV